MASRFVPRVFNQTRGYASQAAIRPPIQLEGLAGKYASAAYVSALTRGEKNLAKLESDLKYFNDVLKSDSQDATKLRTFLTNPTVTAEARSKTISDLLASQKGGADELTRNLFDALSENGRLGLSEKVIEDFLQLTSAHRGEVIITITSAKPLDKSITSRLESSLKGSQFATTAGAKSVKFDYKVNEALQGGFSIDLGDRSVDLSVANRVNKLNALLRESV
ncbi:Similar to S.cerevisiae protein ATP5 (Subunit 5 of the stator stalk of mitochondrial F1F0 ATP synthase) [Malassezia sympodialis ATCC 42132]|uniref:ATP synthase subunit 5, mitochondrial n=1 Tax=Malassezia sympodialis (strain ATCC 42132) TaxID=1230383 RepID=A0A1M8A2G8_MALS4|nr:Similar to S.cerevisiae protein ATP5 (Subunit 5 of the stator stalk of mitochondrial F1F0 ATP synthase) [Malassezia sympodialis ATCC 42132]